MTAEEIVREIHQSILAAASGGSVLPPLCASIIIPLAATDPDEMIREFRSKRRDLEDHCARLGMSPPREIVASMRLRLCAIEAEITIPC